MRAVRYHPEAQAEFLHEVAYFAAIHPGLAERYDLAVRTAEALAAQMPDAWPAHIGATRRIVDRRFKFSLVYRFTATEVQVIAIAAHRRRPGYWRTRLSAG